MKTVYLGFYILAKFWVNIQKGGSKNWLIWKHFLLKTNFCKPSKIKIKVLRLEN